MMINANAGNKLRWWQCFALAFAFEALPVVFLATQVSDSPLNIFRGADNPLIFWVGFLILLPGSIAFEPLLSWTHNPILATGFVAAVNIALFTVLMRTIYRRPSAR